MTKQLIFITILFYLCSMYAEASELTTVKERLIMRCLNVGDNFMRCENGEIVCYRRTKYRRALIRCRFKNTKEENIEPMVINI